MIKSAKAYQLVLSTDSFKTATQTVETTDPSYVFDELGWDEKYQIRIKAISNNEDTNDSEFFDCEETQITYPTKLQKVTDVIDVAARVQWKEAVDYTAFEIQKSVDGKFHTADTVLVKDKERTNFSESDLWSRARNILSRNSLYRAQARAINTKADKHSKRKLPKTLVQTLLI